MKKELSIEQLLAENAALASRLEEAEQLINAIKDGEVDAFALHRNDKPEIFTLQSGDYGYRILVENFSAGALTLSEDGLIVYTNNYFPELMGLPYVEVIGKPITHFIAPNFAGVFATLLKESMSGEISGEINLQFGEKLIPVHVSLTSLFPTLPTIGIVITDLTKTKVFEKEIRAKAEQLELKNMELEKMNKDLESFAYISSHDLQEPLRKIQLFVGRLIEEEQHNLSTTGKDMFQRMHLAAKRMQLLIDDLLAYSRSGNTKMELETTDLNQLVQDVQEDLQEEITEKQAVIETGNLSTVNVIPFQFRQMMHNLIGNALKFSHSEVPPKITINSEIIPAYPLLDNKKSCHITVSDNGIGFDTQYSDKIFKVFQRLHTREEFAGTGIGLAIVKRIVENHGGVVSVDSEMGKGSRFDIYFPV